MPGEILSDTALYDGIRELLGVDAIELPDSVVEQLPYLPAAEIAVKRAVGDWQARLGVTEDLVLLQTAVMHATALRLVSRLQQRLRAGERTREFTSGQMDWDALRGDLESGYATCVMALHESGGESEPAAVFTVDGISRQASARGWAD
jgi:hypothetical protein